LNLVVAGLVASPAPSTERVMATPLSSPGKATTKWTGPEKTAGRDSVRRLDQRQIFFHARDEADFIARLEDLFNNWLSSLFVEFHGKRLDGGLTGRA
jgi:hypothetical protein